VCEKEGDLIRKAKKGEALEAGIQRTESPKRVLYGPGPATKEEREVEMIAASELRHKRNTFRITGRAMLL
jgi:hypothetical protein